MGIFDTLKKNIGFSVQEGIVLKAPITGKIVPIEKVPDPVFADKVVGDGLAIQPMESLMVAPCDGIIGKIFETNHAFSMETIEGVELFIHFGLDTVDLKGEGFKRIAKEGQKIKTGDPVIEVDIPYLKANVRSLIAPVVISNMDDVSRLEKFSGNVNAGVDDLLSVYMK